MIRNVIGETAHGQWLGLDRLLVQLWVSHSVRQMIKHTSVSEQDEKKDVIDCAQCLFPETIEGRIDFVGPFGL